MELQGLVLGLADRPRERWSYSEVVLAAEAFAADSMRRLRRSSSLSEACWLEVEAVSSYEGRLRPSDT